MFRKVLVANRGEIALRVLRSLKRLGVASVAVHSDPDRFTKPVLEADEAVRIGPASPAASYLNIEAIIEACRVTGAEAVHPGYGFLSERPDFAEALASAGIAFVGPRPEHMRAFGLKHTAREIALGAGVPLAPGSHVLESAADALAAAARIGYPVMLKSTAGGGGIGMRRCEDEATLADRFESVTRQGGASFGDARVYLERYVAEARHVEVQMFGDGEGGIVTLGERDCSLQRRHQKVVEEAPAPALPEATRRALHDAAAMLGRAVGYASAGTVEFIYDAARDEFYFLEVNTRLQVEHGVTEAIFGIDLVEWMLRQAAGGWTLPAQESLIRNGAAIEARIYAENPLAGFRPSTGLLTEVQFPDDIRVDGWIETGTVVTPHYDPLLAKLIVHAPTREAAIDGLARAIDATSIWGLETNLAYVRAALGQDAFREAHMSTATLGRFHPQSRSIEVLSGGTQTSVQDWPGRLGHWDVGVPPSGPMDARSFRLANRLLGNPDGATALEMTLQGPTLRFWSDATVAITGACMRARLDGEDVTHGAPFAVRGGQTLAIGAIEGPGVRAYLAIRGGIAAPAHMGARATFALGGFGGHMTGLVRTGDTLRLAAAPDGPVPPCTDDAATLTHDWTIGVLLGPHAAPDFFTKADIDTLFAAAYEVHYNSARTGVRLIGPKPEWARKDGGEAGLHPSNIHDNAYAIGAVDFTGDMPIILGPDGPSLGGFVCPIVVASDELWKTGQLRPGDRVRFGLVAPAIQSAPEQHDDAVLLSLDLDEKLVVRRAGDANMLIEFGRPVLDISLRLRVQLLLDALRDARLPGIIDLTPGIRSLQVHFDPSLLPPRRLLDTVDALARALPDPSAAILPSRTVHLPLSWEDEQVVLAMRRYQETVRPDAPWCPSNIEFIRRINGLDSVEDVRLVVFDAEYLVLGLGDVYLGAPVATPLDPRHRLVTTKYNPARPWTPENAVGIGGAYLCIYGMEGPGGYQLFGRTVQMWNAWRRTTAFTDRPLLRFFDRIRFFPVSHEELSEAREAFPHGRYDLRIEDGCFTATGYASFLQANASEIATFQQSRERAFAQERERWAEAGLAAFNADDGGTDGAAIVALPPGVVAIETPVPGNVWKLLVATDDVVEAGQTVAIVESMKTEMRVTAPARGRIASIIARAGREVKGGQTIMTLQAEGRTGA